MHEARRLAGIQALRALAALLVVLDHCLLKVIAADHLPPWVAPFAYRAGTAGVALFFVISGFIMALTASHPRGPGAARSFIARRLLRIAPLYWLATLIYAARLAAGGEAVAPLDLLRSVLFVPYFDAAQALRRVLGVGWTLNFEMYFYLLFAVSLLLPARLGFATIAAVLAVSAAFGTLATTPDNAVATLLTSPMLLYFLAGLAIHALTVKLPRPTLARPSAILLGLSALAAMLIHSATIPILAPALVLAATWLPSSHVERPFLALGDASYSTYLFHGFLLGPLAAVMLASGPSPWATVAFLLLAICGSQLCGLAVHLAIERPMLRAARAYLPARVPGRTQVSVRDQVV